MTLFGIILVSILFVSTISAFFVIAACARSSQLSQNNPLFSEESYQNNPAQRADRHLRHGTKVSTQ